MGFLRKTLREVDYGRELAYQLQWSGKPYLLKQGDPGAREEILYE
jgi:hypothetical protein